MSQYTKKKGGAASQDNGAVAVERNEQTSQMTANKILGKIKGSVLTIIEEMSLVSLQDLYKIHIRTRDSRLAGCLSNTEDRDAIMEKPFGGQRIFSGAIFINFLQLVRAKLYIAPTLANITKI